MQLTYILLLVINLLVGVKGLSEKTEGLEWVFVLNIYVVGWLSYQLLATY